MKTARLNIVLSDENYQKITALAGRWGISKSNVVGVALGQYFDSLEVSKNATVQALQAIAQNELAEMVANVDSLDLADLDGSKSI